MKANWMYCVTLAALAAAASMLAPHTASAAAHKKHSVPAVASVPLAGFACKTTDAVRLIASLLDHRSAEVYAVLIKVNSTLGPHTCIGGFFRGRKDAHASTVLIQSKLASITRVRILFFCGPMGEACGRANPPIDGYMLLPLGQTMT